MDIATTQSGFAFGSAFRTYAFSWFFNFVVTILGALIANGIWGVPLFQVVNVNLSIALFFAIVAFSINVLALVLALFTFQLELIVVGLFGVLLSLLVPFAAIAAFQLYGVLGGLPVADQSFVYDEFMREFASVTTAVATWAGQLSVLEPPAGSTDKAINLFFGLQMSTLRDSLAMVASGLAIISFFAPGRAAVTRRRA